MRFIYKNKKISVIVICVLFFVLGFALGFVPGKLFSKEKNVIDGCVQTPQEAIAIGKIICERKYPDTRYAEGKWECLYVDDDNSKFNTDYWSVYCKDKKGKKLIDIFINNDNAKVLRVMLY